MKKKGRNSNVLGCVEKNEGITVKNQKVLVRSLEKLKGVAILIISKKTGKVLYQNGVYPDIEGVDGEQKCLSFCFDILKDEDVKNQLSCGSAKKVFTIKESYKPMDVSVEEVDWNPFQKAYLIIIQPPKPGNDVRRLRFNNLATAAITKMHGFVAMANLTRQIYAVFHQNDDIALEIPDEGPLQNLISAKYDKIHCEYQNQYLETFALDKVINQFRNGKESVYLEYPMKLMDGEFHWCFSRIIKVTDFGNDVQAIVLSDNIDKRVWAEQEKAEMLKGIEIWYEEYVKIDLENNTYIAFKLGDCESELLFDGNFSNWYDLYYNKLIHPDERERFKDFASLRALKKNLKEDGQQIRGEFRRLKADGNYEWSELIMTCLRDQRTGMRKVIFCYQDISNRKRENGLIDALSNHYSAVYLISLKKWKIRPVRYPESFYDLTNKSNDYKKFITKFLEEQVSEESKEAMLESISMDVIKARFSANSRSKIETIYKTADGEWNKIYILPAPYYSDEQPDIVLAIEDYNEEMQNRFDSTLYSNTLIETYDAIFEINPENGQRSRLVFDGEKLVTEEKNSQELEQDIDLFLDRAQDERFKSEIPEFEMYVSLENVKKYLKKGIQENCREFLVKTGRKYQWYQFTFRYFIEDNKEKILLLVKNIHTQKRKEELQKKAILDALNVAESASKAKTAFLSNMSHDIRTPMNAIIGMTNIAKNHIDDKEKLVDCLGKITTASNHLLNLINNILDMSKIESGTVNIDEEEFEISDLLNSIEAIVTPQMKQKHMDFSIETENLVHDDVMGDTLRIKQVFINIIGNAVKYTNTGGQVKVIFRELPSAQKEQGIFQFVCKDNGIGMSKEFVKRIFKPFERAQNTTTSKVEGTGLGMSITKNLIDMMGGTIEVESELEKGTAITVTLSLKLRKEEPVRFDAKSFKDIGAEKVTGINTSMTVDYTGKRLLLVEDNELNMEIAQDIIGMTGIAIEEAWNGKEAVEKIKNTPENYYDVVLCDIQMPIMDGYEATKEIRSLPRKDVKTLPIIAMTANAFVEDKQLAIKNGMNGHIAKPIDLKELFKVLDKVLYFDVSKGEESVEKSKSFLER